MEESPRHLHGAASAMEESPHRACGTGVQLELGRPYNSEKEKKRLENNGGIRPGKKWPQYLAASLGKRLLVYVRSFEPLQKSYRIKT
jgi:hypothetical protein